MPSANEIIPYLEMCRREGVSLQRGMNYRLHGKHSVILMSTRPNAPYEDHVEDDGRVLIYEGHNENKTATCPIPELVDQPEFTSNRRPTANGKFKNAALAFKSGAQPPERVRVYEKIKDGIWSYNGVFHLEDAWVHQATNRKVFKFKLIAVQGEEDDAQPVPADPNPGRVIPTSVKLAVWKRDGGKCATCAATVNLHFDHIIPWSRGGSSSNVENIQLLCALHNLRKSDAIL